jgi:hypothetical protein
MLQRYACNAWLLALGLGFMALTRPATAVAVNDADAKHIDELIQHLGSKKFQERSIAQKELEAIGAPALEKLKKSIASVDLETSKRARELVRKIEQNMSTAVLLAAKRVRLKVTDVPVPDAVSELARLAGYPIQISGDRTKAATKRITLDTGDVTFWEAFDQLCTHSNLIELIQTQAASTAAFDAWGKRLVIEQNIANFAHTGIVVVAGTAKNEHVSYAGSVRTRVYPIAGAKPGLYQLNLEASAEPRLHGFTMVGTPTLEKAVDDQGQTLFLHTEMNHEKYAPPPVAGFRLRKVVRQTALPAIPLQHQLTLNIQAGERPAARLKELSGSFTAQVVAAPEALITLDNVLKASGDPVHGKNGGLLKLNSIEKLASGDYQVRVHLESPPLANPMAGMILGNGVIQVQQIQIQVGAFGGPPSVADVHSLPELLDTHGNKFDAIQVPSRRMNIINGTVTQDMTILYRGQIGQSDPDRLVVHGSHTVNVAIPFVFHNVALD